MRSLAPPGTRTSSAVDSMRTGLQESVLVTRLFLSPSTFCVRPGCVAYRLQWTLSASVWFARAGEARLLKTCTSMGRPASRAGFMPSDNPAKRVGERRGRPGLPSVFLCALCVSVVNILSGSVHTSSRSGGRNPGSGCGLDIMSGIDQYRAGLTGQTVGGGQESRPGRLTRLI